MSEYISIAGVLSVQVQTHNAIIELATNYRLQYLPSGEWDSIIMQVKT